MNKSIINSYRLNPAPTQRPPTPGVIAGRIVPAVAPTNYRRLVVLAAVILLPVLAIGVVVYAARAVQPAPVAVPSPGVVERVVEATPVVVERVVEVRASPVVVVVTPAPAPVQVAPVAPARQVVPPVAAQPVNPRPVEHRPTARPQPTAVPTRPANVQAAPVPGPQERLLSRPCQFPDAPQGTVIRGYYTDPSGVKRDAMCKPDGWKAAD